jgi:hypothetical protein
MEHRLPTARRPSAFQRARVRSPVPSTAMPWSARRSRCVDRRTGTAAATPQGSTAADSRSTCSRSTGWRCRVKYAINSVWGRGSGRRSSRRAIWYFSPRRHRARPMSPLRLVGTSSSTPRLRPASSGSSDSVRGIGRRVIWARDESTEFGFQSALCGDDSIRRLLSGSERTFPNEPTRRVLRELADVQIVLRITRQHVGDAQRLDLHRFGVGFRGRLFGEPLDVALRE